MSNVKRYLVAVGLVAFVAFLVGCGGSSDKATNPTPTPTDQDDEQVTSSPRANLDGAHEFAAEPSATGDWD